MLRSRYNPPPPGDLGVSFPRTTPSGGRPSSDSSGTRRLHNPWTGDRCRGSEAQADFAHLPANARRPGCEPAGDRRCRIAIRPGRAAPRRACPTIPCQRRRDPPDAGQTGQRDDVHRQAELQGAPGDPRAERGIWPPALPVSHQLHAPQQAAPAHVADHLVVLMQIAQGRLRGAGPARAPARPAAPGAPPRALRGRPPRAAGRTRAT